MFRNNDNPEAKHISLGKIGEDVAIRYLLRRGFSIVERNFRKKYGEIDIVAKAPDKTLVFVEVKTMATGLDLIPEDQYSASKRQKTERICQAFANGNAKLINESRGWRMDLIAIQIPREAMGESSLTKIEKSGNIKYYENA
jgi:putative endonuclease